MKRAIAVFILIDLLLVGCSLIFPAEQPLEVLSYQTGDKRAESLIVMLPGHGDDAGSFEKYGFIREIASSGVQADVMAVNTHIGYYYKKNLTVRLYEDVIVPVRKKGYKNIWLLGISMGGLGALLYARDHPETIEGVLALAPFLGDREVIDEISTAGGLAQWQPKGPVKKADYQRVLWRWLKKYENRVNGLPCLVVGYGDQDRFAFANGLLAAILPDDHVYVLPGGHDGETWCRLFNQILKSGVMDTAVRRKK